MEYRAVDDRCAIDLCEMPLRDAPATLSILRKMGFEVLEIDMIALARSCIGSSTYQLGTHSSHAPSIVDCSSFTKWLYGRRGIYIPRRALQQRDFGYPIAMEELVAGDLIFISGCNNYYRRDPLDSVGHVGIATSEETVVHADKRMQVVESQLGLFKSVEKFRGARRYIPQNAPVITLKIPKGIEVESSDDIRLLLLSKA